MAALSRVQTGGLLGVMLACFATPLTTPFNIGVMIEEFGASASQAGFVATVDGLVGAAAALITSRFLTRFASRQFFLVGLSIIATGHLMSAFAPSLNWLMILQAYAGVGVGMVLSVVMATAARTANPEMTIGLINASLGAFIIFLGFVVPTVIALGGLMGAYLTYSAVACFGLIAAMVGPNSKAPKPEELVAAQAQASGDAPTFEGSSILQRRVALIGLIGIGLFFFGQAGLAAFAERIGNASGLSLEQIGHVFAFGGFLTIVGPLIAGWIGARFGATLPLAILVSGLCVAAFGLAVLTSPLSFYISAPLYTLLPGLLTPSFLGALSFLDKTGKSMGMHPAFSTLGGSLGPYFSGAVLDKWGFSGVGYYAITIFIVAALLMAVATINADRGRRGNSKQEAVPA